MNVGGAGEKKSSSQSSPLSPPGLVKRRHSPRPVNESQGQFNKRQPQVNKIDTFSQSQLGITNTFEFKLKSWVANAVESEKANRLEAQKRILDAQKNNAETLDLSGLNLTDVPPLDVLTTHLKTLNLANNRLTTLENGCFDGLTALQRLYIENNQLTTLQNGCFKELTALHILNLDNNQLSTLPNGCFDGLTALKWLYLSYNQLTTLLDRGLSVDGDLYLEGCTGLTSLPESLSVGGDLYLKGCTGLTSLPEWVFELGDTQYVDATNTGIPVRLLEIYNHRQNEAGYSGPRIEFSILDNQSSDDVTADQLPQR